jgi:hypothetical protein
MRSSTLATRARSRSSCSTHRPAPRSCPGRSVPTTARRPSCARWGCAREHPLQWPIQTQLDALDARSISSPHVWHGERNRHGISEGGDRCKNVSTTPPASAAGSWWRVRRSGQAHCSASRRRRRTPRPSFNLGSTSGGSTVSSPRAYGGPTGFKGAERYQYALDREGRAISALRAMKKAVRRPTRRQTLDFLNAVRRTQERSRSPAVLQK